MKIEECKEVVYKSKSFSGNMYILEDKDIILNSIYICEVKDSSPVRNVCDFSVQRLSKDQYKIFIPDYTIICNSFFINYGVLRNVNKLTLNKSECPDITKKEDGSIEIIFQEDNEK